MSRMGFWGFLGIFLGQAFAGDALANDLSCVGPGAHPPTAMVWHEGNPPTKPLPWTIAKIIPGYCIMIGVPKFSFWTTLDAKGGVTCNGKVPYIDFNKAFGRLSGIRTYHFVPAECGPPFNCPHNKTPPERGPGPVYVQYPPPTFPSGNGYTPIAQVEITSVSNACYKVDYSGFPLWFPKAALKYDCALRSIPAALDYTMRRDKPC